MADPVGLRQDPAIARGRWGGKGRETRRSRKPSFTRPIGPAGTHAHTPTHARAHTRTRPFVHRSVSEPGLTPSTPLPQARRKRTARPNRNSYTGAGEAYPSSINVRELPFPRSCGHTQNRNGVPEGQTPRLLWLPTYDSSGDGLTTSPQVLIRQIRLDGGFRVLRLSGFFLRKLVVESSTRSLALKILKK